MMKLRVRTEKEEESVRVLWYNRSECTLVCMGQGKERQEARTAQRAAVFFLERARKLMRMPEKTSTVP